MKHLLAQWGQKFHIHKLKTIFGAAIILSLYLLLFSSGNFDNNEIPSAAGQVLMELPKCKCSKYVKYNPLSPNYGVQNSTCSKESFVRGPGQKVVGKFIFMVIALRQLTDN